MKVLLIEDDRAIGDVLTHALTSQHWVVEQALDGESGLELADNREFDLILLDIGLPRLDGITVCKRLRHGGYQNPILLLTGQDSTEAQIAGLDAGADDYLAKPFNLEILMARLRALARKGKPAPTVITWETIQLDPASSEVTCQGRLVHLTAKEYSLLELFLLNPKHIYSRRAMLDRLWDLAEFPGEETISTHIKCIRQKLKAAGAADPIETVYGLGYRLRSAEAPAASSPDADEPPNPSHQQKAQAVASRVWNQFKAQYLEQIQHLSTLVHQLQPGPISESAREVQRVAHKLVGSLGMFGLDAASREARILEQLILQASTLEVTHLAAATHRVAALQQAIALAQTVLPPKAQPLAPTAPAIAAQILIVDDDLLLADCLRLEAEACNFKVEIATDLSVARQMVAQSPPDLILLDLNFPGEENGLTLMRELEQRSPRIPIVIFTAREDLRDRVAAARLGASAFLHKPLPAYAILKTVTDVLNRTGQPPEQHPVLVVDDDPAFLQILASLLQDTGMQVTTCTHPQDFWQILIATRPDVLILDLAMPEFDGVELCQVVRTDPQWTHLKILFLSSHTDPETVARAYAAGADDYIPKTLSTPELVTRILHRIGRN